MAHIMYIYIYMQFDHGTYHVYIYIYISYILQNDRVMEEQTTVFHLLIY